MKRGAGQTKLFLADDQLTFHTALNLWLEQVPGYELVGHATRAHTLVEQVQATQPDILLLDWDLADLRSEKAKAELIHTLKMQFPHLRMIALSSLPGASQHILATGVHAFVSKTESPDRLLAALQQNRVGE